MTTQLGTRKRHATAKPIKLICGGSVTGPVNLLAADDVKIVISKESTGFARVVAPATVADQSIEANWGKVSYQLTADDVGDDLEEGAYKVEIRAHWPDGSLAIFPEGEYLRMFFLNDLPTELPPPTP